MLGNFLISGFLLNIMILSHLYSSFRFFYSQYCSLSEYSRIYLSNIQLMVIWVVTQFRSNINCSALNFFLHISWRINTCTHFCQLYPEVELLTLDFMLSLKRCHQTVFRSDFYQFPLLPMVWNSVYSTFMPTLGIISLIFDHSGGYLVASNYDLSCI